MSIHSVHSTTVPHGYVEPKIAPSGFASIPARTVNFQFKDTVSKHGNRPAMHLKRKVDGKIPSEWKTWTWNEYYHDSVRFAKSLIHLDMKEFKIINILGFNSPEWFISNMGAILAGCISAGIYTSNLAESCKYISEHSAAEVVVVEDNKQLAKYAQISSELSHLKALVMWAEPINAEIASKCSVPVYSWEDFLNLGAAVPETEVDLRGNLVRPGNCCSLIYTSGTTGPPKAVMISHDNLTWTVRNVTSHYMPLGHEDRFVSYLPLSHIAAQLIDIYAPLDLGSSTYFCQPDALKGSLTVTMREVKPTIFFGVPRVWEKMQEKLVQLGRETTGVKKTLSTWAKATGLEHCKRAQFGCDYGKPWGYGCANSLVLSKIKEALGLDKSKGCFTAAAPISPDTLWYFAQLDLPIYEVFGQSECTGPHTVSYAKQWRIGYCGRPMQGTESKIEPSTQELCYRGRHIFMGYMYMPDKTAETIDNEGYLHSGDVAEFDENPDPRVTSGPAGFMRITGRIKELIITAGGENIPPVLIENEVKAAMVAVSNCMVIGDRRKFLTLLLSLKTEVEKESGHPTDKLAADSLFVGKSIGSAATTMSEAAVDPAWIKYINDGIKVANSKTTSHAQVIQKWKMLPVDFSEKGGELTPTLKIKRNVVCEIHANLIESMYEGSNE